MMSSSNFNNLVKAGQLKSEPMDKAECHGLIRSGTVKLKDARNKSLSEESRFDLAYNAAHALALAALRHHGYRAVNRYIVFLVLPQTTELGAEVWRVLVKCHEKRNVAEYEGYLEIDERLLHDLVAATETLLARVSSLVGY